MKSKFVLLLSFFLFTPFSYSERQDSENMFSWEKKEKLENKIQVENKTYINATLEDSQKVENMDVLKSLEEDSVTQLLTIELALEEGRYGDALSLAKKALDNVKVKTGINPKSRLKESFLTTAVFSKNSTSFKDLSDFQKNQVIRTISEFRGGLYLDIMNLSKRVTLLYIKAFQTQLLSLRFPKSTGQILSSDITQKRGVYRERRKKTKKKLHYRI